MGILSSAIQTHTQKWIVVTLTTSHFTIGIAFKTLTLRASDHILESTPTFHYSTHTSFVEKHMCSEDQMFLQRKIGTQMKQSFSTSASKKKTLKVFLRFLKSLSQN
jgi:hypothetical protein